MLKKLIYWIKYPFIYLWNSFVIATFDDNLHIDDHPKGGTRVWQDHKLFGIKFTITIVKQTPESPEVVYKTLERIFKDINQKLDNKLAIIPLQSEETSSNLPTKKKVAKKKPIKKSLKKKALPKKKSRK